MDTQLQTLPEEVGLSSARLERIDGWMRGWVDGGRLPCMTAVAQIEPASHDQSDAGLLGALMRPSNAREGIVVGDAERRQAKQLGLRHQLLDMRGAAQERVVRGDLQLRVAGHGLSGPASADRG